MHLLLIVDELTKSANTLQTRICIGDLLTADFRFDAVVTSLRLKIEPEKELVSLDSESPSGRKLLWLILRVLSHSARQKLTAKPLAQKKEYGPAVMQLADASAGLPRSLAEIVHRLVRASFWPVIVFCVSEISACGDVVI